MEIHRPKVAHGWREFAVEIGIIVCGILIAISLEQVVEWVHWRHEVQEAREALHEELAYDAGMARFLVDQDACVQERLDLFRSWARGETTINSTRLYALDNYPTFGALRANAWDVAKSGEVAAHMPLAEKIAFAQVYDLILNQQLVIQNTRITWRALVRYTDKTTLTDAERSMLAADVAEARTLAVRLADNAVQLVDAIRRLGISPAQVTLRPGVSAKTLCGPLN